jgi:hypothetical protein
MRQSVSKGQGEGFARRECWSSAISDRSGKRSVKGGGKDEGKEVESNGAAHVHVTVSMSLEVLVDQVRCRGRAGKGVRGKGNGR